MKIRDPLSLVSVAIVHDLFQPHGAKQIGLTDGISIQLS
jgi:hypothetical protein